MIRPPSSTSPPSSPALPPVPPAPPAPPLPPPRLPPPPPLAPPPPEGWSASFFSASQSFVKPPISPGPTRKLQSPALNIVESQIVSAHHAVHPRRCSSIHVFSGSPKSACVPLTGSV